MRRLFQWLGSLPVGGPEGSGPRLKFGNKLGLTGFAVLCPALALFFVYLALSRRPASTPEQWWYYLFLATLFGLWGLVSLVGALRAWRGED